MQASTETLEANKVKLSIEVDEAEIEAIEEETFRRLVQEVRLPGFRPGKVPRRLIASRLGKEAIREEVLKDALPRYYAEALEQSELDAIAPPDIDVTSGEVDGPLAFDAVVEIRPKVAIIGYEGLVATLPSPVASEEEVDAQLDRMRQQFATLTEVSRPARDGDLVTLDVHGTRDGEPAEGLSADDLVYEVGTGGIVAGIDERLFGAKVGDIFELDAEDAPDGPAHLRVLVKLVREKVLPDLDDAFAADASEFDTLDELRADLEQRITQVKTYQANVALRERAIEALVELVGEEPPERLVAAEVEHLLEDFAHRLAHQQLTIEGYLTATGQEPEALRAELEAQAVAQVKADLALRALAAAEGLEADESDLDEEIVRLADQAGQSPAALRSRLEKSGRMAGLRSQIKNAKAMTWLVEHVGIVDDEGKPMDRTSLSMPAGPSGSVDAESPEPAHSHS